MAEEKSFKYVIVGGGVAAVSLSFSSYVLVTAHCLALDVLFKKNYEWAVTTVLRFFFFFQF